ncbi:MAG: rRNA ((1915)-N(3))-methyltransferase RlmH [Enterovirga sp.]|nr:rRNA ((1915)-N(3))-methyltransferase RlmH [Enterovirga sp.]
MRLQVVAIGRLKSGPERDLVERYRLRADALGRSLGVGPLDLHEMAEGRARSAPERQAEEAAAILARVGDARLVAFDERGASQSSEDFAGQVRAWRDEGAGLALAIGGPDGLSPLVRSRAQLVLSFGRLTLPHQIVRILVVEQLYRALTILAGHPYHRGEPGRA